MSLWQPITDQIPPTITQGACCIPLAHLACVEIQGEQTDSLLQGQLTCDMKSLDGEHWSPAAHCTPKGRMISNFQLHRTDLGCRLILSADLATVQTQALGKYSPLYRGQAQVVDQSEQLLGIGLIGEQALAQLSTLDLPLPEAGQYLTSGDCMLIRQADSERLMLWCPAEQAMSIWQQLSQAVPAALPERWQLAEIQQGRALVTQPLSDRFIPQQLNLDAIGAISFNKGCYTGQEIVARLHYRGKQKNHLHRIRFEGPIDPDNLTLIRADNGEQAGELINFAATDVNSFEALAVIRDNDLKDSIIELAGSHGKAVSLLEFPYTVENE